MFIRSTENRPPQLGRESAMEVLASVERDCNAAAKSWNVYQLAALYTDRNSNSNYLRGRLRNRLPRSPIASTVLGFALA